jgi:hypothetical protein
MSTVLQNPPVARPEPKPAADAPPSPAEPPAPAAKSATSLERAMLALIAGCFVLLLVLGWIGFLLSLCGLGR